jgi:hypothetical protein
MQRIEDQRIEYDPYQGGQLRAILGVHTEQYSHIGRKGRKGSLGWFADEMQ